MASIFASTSPWAVEARVIRALVLRDTRARFGSGFFSFLVAIAIPFGHLMGLMAVPLVANTIAPIGTDYALFVATGVLPYILCLYPARMIMLSLVDSGPLLGFPVVKPLDVMVARAVLETIVAFTVAILFILVLSAMGLEVIPYDAAAATGAIFSAIYLAIGIGFISAILFKLTRIWMFVLLVWLIGMYLSSGAVFLPRMLPAEVRNILWFNPLFQCVEWMRLAYYEGYGQEFLSRQYLLGFSTMLVLLGLSLERLIRGRLTIA